MLKLEIVLKRETSKGYEFYILDQEKMRTAGESDIAVVKVITKPSDTDTALEKVLKVIEEMYENEEYIVKYE